MSLHEQQAMPFNLRSSLVYHHAKKDYLHADNNVSFWWLCLLGPSSYDQIYRGRCCPGLIRHSSTVPRPLLVTKQLEACTALISVLSQCIFVPFSMYIALLSTFSV